MQDLKLITASVNDISEITQLAKVVWNQHYPTIIGQAQIDYMLNLMYSHQSLTEQMTKKGHRFYFIALNNINIGFISVNEEQASEWFLNKFYIDQSKASKGLGAKAFNELLSALNPKQITLTVNRQNYKSINFYFKTGFKIDRVADFDIGNGYVMNDFVMVWKKQID